MTHLRDDRRQRKPLAVDLPNDDPPEDQLHFDGVLDFESQSHNPSQLSAPLLLFGVPVLLPIALVPALLWDVMRWWPIIFLCGIGSIAGAWITHRTHKRNARTAALLHLKKARCASCLYPLHDLPLESDGCTICPECGAAWKLEGLA